MQSYETSRCLLRVVKPSDATAVFECFSDPAVMAYYDMTPVTDLIEAEQMLHGWIRDIVDGRRCRWAIVLKDSGQVVGTCGLHGIRRDRGCAELGYEVARAYWGKGIASDVFPALLEHAFHALQLDRLTARISPRNRASIALVRKFGFRIHVVPQIAGWLDGASFRRRIFRLTQAEYTRRMRKLDEQARRSGADSPGTPAISSRDHRPSRA